MLNILANNLLTIRKAKRMTQKEVAEKVGITATALSAYEKAQREPSLGVILKLADFYGVSLDWLCGRRISKDSSRMSRADFLRFLSDVYEELQFKPNYSDMNMKCTLDIEKISGVDASSLMYRYKKYYDKELVSNMAIKVSFEFSSLDNWMWSYFQSFNDLLNVQAQNALSVDVVTPWKNAELSYYEDIPLFKQNTTFKPVKEEMED